MSLSADNLCEAPSDQLLELAGNNPQSFLEENSDHTEIEQFSEENAQLGEHASHLKTASEDEYEGGWSFFLPNKPKYDFSNGDTMEKVQACLEVVGNTCANIADIAGIISIVANVAGWVLSVLLPPVGAALQVVGKFLMVVEIICNLIAAACSGLNVVIDAIRLANCTDPELRQKYIRNIAENTISAVGRAAVAGVSAASSAKMFKGGHHGANLVDTGARLAATGSRTGRVVGGMLRGAGHAGHAVNRGARAVGRAATAPFRAIGAGTARVYRAVGPGAIGARLSARSARFTHAQTAIGRTADRLGRQLRRAGPGTGRRFRRAQARGYDKIGKYAGDSQFTRRILERFRANGLNPSDLRAQAGIYGRSAARNQRWANRFNAVDDFVGGVGNRVRGGANRVKQYIPGTHVDDAAHAGHHADDVAHAGSHVDDAHHGHGAAGHGAQHGHHGPSPRENWPWFKEYWTSLPRRAKDGFLHPWHHGAHDALHGAEHLPKHVQRVRAFLGGAHVMLPELAEVFYAYKYGYYASNYGVDAAISKYRAGVDPTYLGDPTNPKYAGNWLLTIGVGTEQGLFKKIMLAAMNRAQERWGHGGEKKVGPAKAWQSHGHGHGDGHGDGHDAGHGDGHDAGHGDGHDAGHDTGHETGHDAGHHEPENHGAHSETSSVGDHLLRMAAIQRQIEVYSVQLAELQATQHTHDAAAARTAYLNALPIPTETEGDQTTVAALDSEISVLTQAESDANEAAEVFRTNLETQTQRKADADTLIEEIRTRRDVVAEEQTAVDEEATEIEEGRAGVEEGKSQADEMRGQGERGEEEGNATNETVSSTKTEPKPPPPEEDVPWYRIDKHIVNAAKAAWRATVGRALRYIGEKWAQLQEYLTQMVMKFVMQIAGVDDIDATNAAAEEQSNTNTEANADSATALEETTTQLDEADTTANETATDAEQQMEAYAELIVDAEDTAAAAADRRAYAEEWKASLTTYMADFEATYGTTFEEAGGAAGENLEQPNHEGDIEALQMEIELLSLEYEELADTVVAEQGEGTEHESGGHEVAEHHGGEHHGGGEHAPAGEDHSGEHHEGGQPESELEMLTDEDLDAAILEVMDEEGGGESTEAPVPDVENAGPTETEGGEAPDLSGDISHLIGLGQRLKVDIQVQKIVVQQMLDEWATEVSTALGVDLGPTNTQGLEGYHREIDVFLADLDSALAEASGLQGQEGVSPEVLDSYLERFTQTASAVDAMTDEFLMQAHASYMAAVDEWSPTGETAGENHEPVHAGH